MTRGQAHDSTRPRVLVQFIAVTDGLAANFFRARTVVPGSIQDGKVVADPYQIPAINHVVGFVLREVFQQLDRSTVGGDRLASVLAIQERKVEVASGQCPSVLPLPGMSGDQLLEARD